MSTGILIFFISCHICSALCSTDSPFIYGNATAEPPCLLVPTVSDAGQTLASLANDEKQLVKIRVSIKGENGKYMLTEDRFTRLVISTSVTGEALLMLKEYFDAMSLYTLGQSVDNYEVVLNQSPKNCLKNKSAEELESILRTQFLTSFGSGSSLPAGAEICNRHAGKEEGNYGSLIYVCCSLNAENNLQCAELTKTIWIQLLFISIIILQVFIILYSPLHLPGFMYKANSIFQTYIYTAEVDKSFKLRVKVVPETSNDGNGFIKAELQDFTHLRKFRKQLEALKQEKVHNFSVKSVEVCVKDSKIVSEGNAPVTFLRFFRDFIVRCKLRYEIDSVRDCCMQDMWVLLPCNIVFRWYQFLSGIMMIVSALFLTVPWLLRIWFYYSIEEKEVEFQTKLYNKYNLSMPYPGNLITYLSPTHPLFMVIHILFGVEILVYIIMPGSIKEKLKFTVRKCFRDTKDKSTTDACGIMASHMLRPLKRFGIIGCLVMPLWLIVLPLYLLAVLLEVIPIANLSLRLLINLVFYVTKVINPNIFRSSDEQVPGKLNTWMEKKFGSIIVVNENEENSRLNKLIHFVALIMTFITMWLFLIILIECIAFYVECTVYALVGFILDPRRILKYVSLLLLILVYANESFKGVHDRYAAYCTAINSEVQSMVGEKMTDEASKSSEEQENTAFRVPAKVEVPERMCLVTGSEGFLKWKVSRLVLFLDKSDNPYIPTSFLFQMGQLNHYQCPGLMHLLYFKAFVNFLWIILFLAFVFIVIFAFGQANDISSAGQAIAALATGFFPLILKKFLFKSLDNSVDRSNLNWKNMFANAVQKYSEAWLFADIIVNESQVTQLESKPIPNEAVVELNETDGADMNNFTEICKKDEDATENLTENKVKNLDETVDLIVKRGSDSSLTFYVPNAFRETDDIYREQETIL